MYVCARSHTCGQMHAVEVEVRIRHFCEDGFAKFPSDCGSSASMLIKLAASTNSQQSAHTDSKTKLQTPGTI